MRLGARAAAGGVHRPAARAASMAWFAVVAAARRSSCCAHVGHWYRRARRRMRGAARTAASAPHRRCRGGGRRARSPCCSCLIFSKYIYLASLSSYYTFYLIDKFDVSVQSAQLHLFVFLGAVAAGTILGGPIGDRIGRKYVIWGSILGVLPFTLALPHANLFWTGVLTRGDRPGAGVGVLGDPGLRAGAGARPRRHDRGPLLRLRVRHRRPRRGACSASSPTSPA